MSSTLHKQKWIKANVHVDAKLVPLIEALSLFPQLETFESCQGSKGEPCVVFFYDGLHPWKDIASFVLDYFGPKLAREIGDRASICLEVSSWGIIQGVLSVFPEAMQRTVKTIKKIARKYKN